MEFTGNETLLNETAAGHTTQSSVFNVSSDSDASHYSIADSTGYETEIEAVPEQSNNFCDVA